MAKNIVVIGAGGFGREVCDIVEASNAAIPGSYKLLGVVDDAPSSVNMERLATRNIPYLGTIQELITEYVPSELSYVLGINSPSVKKKLAMQLDESGFSPSTFIHPSATLGSNVELGVGNVICAGARLTTNISLGAHVHVNINSTIGHDVTIGDYVSINPLAAISGDIVIEDLATIGSSAFLLQGLTIGTGSTVGAGSCVVKPVETGAVVKGVPAR